MINIKIPPNKNQKYIENFFIIRGLEVIVELANKKNPK